MATKTRTDRRTDALSKTRIVDAAIQLLDTEGEAALTFRALAARLETGSGAIYWHVSNKDDLLIAATDHVITSAVATTAKASTAPDAIRALSLGIFDAIDAHPWLGSQLNRNRLQYAVLRILEGLGQQVRRLGVPAHAQFDVATALLNFIFGMAGQAAAVARSLASATDTDRATHLGAIAAQWACLDESTHPFVRRMATSLPTHDDRAQFLAGINLILAGIENS